MPAGHAVGLPHWPHELQVCKLLPEHCVFVGVHTANPVQEHGPQPQPVLHFCVPYEFDGHGCVDVGEHVP